MKIYDPNTEKFEDQTIKVNVFNQDDKFNKIVGQICAQTYLNIHSQDKEVSVEISKAFGVLHKDTAMIAKIKLDAKFQTENEMDKVEMLGPKKDMYK